MNDIIVATDLIALFGMSAVILLPMLIDKLVRRFKNKQAHHVTKDSE